MMAPKIVREFEKKNPQISSLLREEWAEIAKKHGHRFGGWEMMKAAKEFGEKFLERYPETPKLILPSGE